MKLTKSGKPRVATHYAQWAAQFAVASELCKRQCQVALTMGNHPAADLMVISPKGTPFVIDVKGLRAPAPWLVRRKADIKSLYYVLAFVPAGKPNQFFIMSQATANRLIRGDTAASDIRWVDAMDHHDKWSVLPD
jgi:hypothetical protein